MFKRRVLPWLVYILYRLWSFTWRLEVYQSPALLEARGKREPLVFAHWHGDELCIVPLIPDFKIATMVSTSSDGALMDFCIRRLGGATSRGSSTRGAVGALKGLVRLMQAGHPASLAVDGPKGPLHKVKPGVFELSRLAHAKIVPLGAAVSNPIVFHKSWNKAQLPKPFSRVFVHFGEPWPPLTRDLDAKDPAITQRLELEIANACQAAASHLR